MPAARKASSSASISASIGAGDVFTSALCGELLCGKAPMDALDSAADFCDRCIHETVKRQPWHWYGLAFEPVLKGNHV